MYKKLRKQMTTTVVVITVMCLMLIIGMALSISGEIFTEINRKNINSMDKYDLVNGIDARGRINAILDYFGTDDEGYFYIIPFGEDQYIGMYVYDDMDTNAYEIMEDTYDYLIDERDSLDRYMHTTGTIYRMEDICEEYYQSWFIESEYLGGNSIDLIEKYALSYLYVVDSTNVLPISGRLILMSALIVGTTIIMIFLMILIPSTSNGKVKKYITNNGLSLEAVESDYMNGLRLNGKYVFGRKYVFYPTAFKNRIVANSDVIWIYKHLQVTEHSVYGVKTHTTTDHSVFVKLRSGKCIVINSKSDSHSDDIVMALSKLYSFAFAGWSQELQSLSKKNYPELIRVVDQRRINGQV